MKVICHQDRYDGSKYEIKTDLSSWAKKFLNGRLPRVEIAGETKLGEVIDQNSAEENTDEGSVESLERFWSRKGIKIVYLGV